MYLFLALATFFIILTAIVAMFETRMVWPHSGPQPGPVHPDQNGYLQFHVMQAIQAGFQLLAWTYDMKGAMYKISYAFVVSPDRECLGIIAAGSIGSIPISGTWLYSRDSNGTLSYSTDKQSCSVVDISGVIKCQLVPDAALLPLVQNHRDWLHSRGVMPVAFPTGAEIDDLRTLTIAHRKEMARKGLINFTDQSEERWRYSFVGAWKLSFINYWIGLVRAITFGKFPKTA
jgi:hypothetical protein